MLVLATANFLADADAIVNIVKWENSMKELWQALLFFSPIIIITCGG